MSSAFDTGWVILKAPWYYHATPEKNVMPILHEGLKGGIEGVYASKDPELARRWISSFQGNTSPKIGVIPFWRDEGDPRISPGEDHSRLLIDMIMGPDYESREGDSVVHSDDIPPKDLLPQMTARGTPSNEDRSAGNPAIEIWDNPMYLGDDFREKMEMLRQRIQEEQGEQNDE